MAPARTFMFGRLDAQQATIAIASYKFIAVYLLELEQATLEKAIISYNDEDDHAAGFFSKSNQQTFFQVMFSLGMFCMASAVCAVLYRKRWLLMPWIVLIVIAVLFDFWVLINDFESKLPTDLTRPTGLMILSLLIACKFTSIVFEIYCLVVCVTCFQVLGAANQDTADRDSTMTAQLQLNRSEFEFVPFDA